MGTIGGGEVLVVFLVALIVLGPEKLPEAVRRLARVAGELRNASAGFQQELRDVLAEPPPRIAEPSAAGAPPPAPPTAAGQGVPRSPGPQPAPSAPAELPEGIRWPDHASDPKP